MGGLPMIFAPLAALALAASIAAPPPVTFTAEQDHQNMMDQLHITKLRPGPSGDEKAPNHANYDEAKANPYPDWPDILTFRDDEKVATAAQWRRRRAEIVDDLERSMYGRIPVNVPRVTWSAVTDTETLGNVPVTTAILTGHADNSAAPSIDVDIKALTVLPANARGPVPVLIMLSWAPVHFLAPSPNAPKVETGPVDPMLAGFLAKNPNPDLERVQTLVNDGWGVVLLNPGSIQADNGAGLTRGIIGLTNKGQPRKPDDWGALRAWGWGASRLLDYLSTLPQVDPAHIGVEGVSRYGKAALVAAAFDERFGFVLVGSSGEGGAKPSRRNFGEAVESLTGTGEYHWMAGNFLQYGGPKTPGDLPADAHELIALCAPRPTFISYGNPAAGDANWLDQQGSFMATVAAGKVWTLLGARDLGVGNDYKTAVKPPIGTNLLDGQLAWRQHEGGHTDTPNLPYFLKWADRQMGRQP
jgi:hypothetical protein